MIETAKEYLSLNYQHMAICPFHKDTKPSLKVYDDHWYCFGACGEGGDVVDFLCRIKNISIKELLEKYGGEKFK